MPRSVLCRTIPLVLLLASCQMGSHAHRGGDHAGHDHHASHEGSAMGLVAAESATHTAVQSGAWREASTWKDGLVPTDGAHVNIPAGISVEIDGELDTRIDRIGLRGTLWFSPDVSTHLQVGTLISSMDSELMVGSPETPIADDVEARITFLSSGRLDREDDPAQVSGGAMLMGRTLMHGREVTHRLTLAAPAHAGDERIVLSEIPTGWRVGDAIVLAGTELGDPESDERRTIAAIDGSTLTLDDALGRDHVAPDEGLEVHVAHLDRNIVLTSESDDIAERGHLMLMHTLDVQLSNVRFEKLGRTDKRVQVDDWYFPDLLSVNAEPGPGHNPRGRYAVHFHRGGVGIDTTPALVRGCVAEDNPGWAYVNHSSHVDFIDNVSYDVVGGAFQTEAGDELGSFVGNIAIRTINPDYPLLSEDERPVDIREDTQDFAFQGDGFWIHGGGVSLIDNVASGSSGHGFIFWTEGLREVDTGFDEINKFRVENLPHGDLLEVDELDTWWVPLAAFRGNQAYAATHGMATYYIHSTLFEDIHDLTPAYLETVHSTFEDTTIWNVTRYGVELQNSERFTFRNLRLYQDGDPETVGIHTMPTVGARTIFDQVDIRGFGTGLILPTRGDVTVRNSTFANRTDVEIAPAEADPGRPADNRDVLFDGVDFVPSDFYGEEERVTFHLRGAEVLDGAFERSNEEEVYRLFAIPDRLVVAPTDAPPYRLYFSEQHPDVVPVPSARIPEGGAGDWVDAIADRTNGELMSNLGLAFGGALLPADATTRPDVVGGHVSDVDDPVMNIPACLFINEPPPPANLFDDFDFHACWDERGGIAGQTEEFNHDSE